MVSKAADPILRVDSSPVYEFVLSLVVWSDTAHHDLYAIETDSLNTVRRLASANLLSAVEALRATQRCPSRPTSWGWRMTARRRAVSQPC